MDTCYKSMHMILCLTKHRDVMSIIGRSAGRPLLEVCLQEDDTAHGGKNISDNH